MTLSDKIIVFFHTQQWFHQIIPTISKEFQTRIMYDDYSDEKGENKENTNKKVYDTRHKE